MVGLGITAQGDLSAQTVQGLWGWDPQGGRMPLGTEGPCRGQYPACWGCGDPMAVGLRLGLGDPCQ